MKKIVSIFATLLLVLITVTPAFANSQVTELFDALKLSDGAETDAILSNLEKHFLQNPEEFLNELNNQDANIRNIVVNNFSIWATGEEESARQLAEVIGVVAENPAAEELITAYNSQEDLYAGSVLKSIKGENMGKTNLGWLIFAIGLSTLSLEIYFLKIVQLLDQMVTHSWNGYIDYIFVDGAIFLSMCISGGVMLIGLVQIIQGYIQ